MPLNCVELFYQREKDHPQKPALWLPGQGITSFAELRSLGDRTQGLMRRLGIVSGDAVLVFEPLGPRLYGALIGLMAMGVGVALVEPWMPVAKINHVLPFVKPKAFLAGVLGFAWGSRVSTIRKIPHWVLTHRIHAEQAGGGTRDVEANTPAIITFTSGTTGQPKGMVRTHGYLMDQHRIFVEALHSEVVPGADLCIFANFALANLASGRTSVIMPPSWHPAHFKALNDLPTHLQPTTLTAGPAFLLEILRRAELPKLAAAHVGGALTDCAIFERAFAKWPKTEWSHLYGSTEVEPVALAPAKRAVKLSRDQGYFQTLLLGSPIPAIRSELGKDTLWVSGPHVCPRYLANDEENQKHKRTDAKGQIWHRMGDRIQQEGSEFWYAGREAQTLEDFQAEQKMYAALGSSAAFLARDASGRLVAHCLHGNERAPLIRSVLPEVKEVFDTMIVRDRRHRARVDRVKSLGRRVCRI